MRYVLQVMTLTTDTLRAMVDGAREADHPLNQLRGLLAASGYRTEATREILSVRESAEDILANTGKFSFLFGDQLSATKDAISALSALFLFSCDVSEVHYRSIDESLRSALKELQLVENVDGKVRARVSLVEYRNCYFLADKLFHNFGNGHIEGNRPERDEDVSMPFHASSLELYRGLTTRPPVRSFLDIGCGNGCQSILRDCEPEARIVGFDISAKSAAYAQVNAILNVRSIDYHVGDCLTYDDGHTYQELAFNAPNQELAIEFVNTHAKQLLGEDATLIMWTTLEVGSAHANLDAALIATMPALATDYTFEVTKDAQSPFALSNQAIQSGRMPFGSLLTTGDPAEDRAFLQRLAANGVARVESILITLRRAA